MFSNGFKEIISKSINKDFKPCSVNLQQSGKGPWILKSKGVEIKTIPFGFKILWISLTALKGFKVCSKTSVQMIKSKKLDCIFLLLYSISK